MTEIEQYYQAIQEAKIYIEREWDDSFPSTIVVTGTGLASIADDLEVLLEIDYKDIPNFPKSTVQSHPGKLVVCKSSHSTFALLQGRWHYYEGYTAKQITFPLRVMKALGASHAIFTNVAGGVNADYEAGDLVIVTDHINMIPDNPLRGPNDDRLGIRFPDMLHTYDQGLINKIETAARELNIKTQRGVYLALAGPSLETPAEYKMIHNLGADLVGMSTVPEAIAAKHSDMKVAVISIVSNVCYPPERLSETTIDEVIAVAQGATLKLNKILKKII